MTTTDPQRTIHRQGLTREVSDPQLFRFTAAEEEDGDGLNIEGHWAVFDTPTLIYSWEGRFWEKNARGAFRKTLRENTPKMQFDHGRHPLLGSLPLGTWKDSGEDDVGAWSSGRLSDNWLIQPFRDSIRDGAVTGMSYRFEVIREEWRDPEGKKVKPEDAVNLIWDHWLTEADESELLTRIMLEARVTEAGPVVWPAYETTDVGVRSKVTIDLARLQDPDQRATLARAVILADRSESSHNADEGLEPAAPPASPETRDGHPADQAPVATDAPPAPSEAPEGHPSVPPPSPATDARAQLRATARELSAYVASMRGATRRGR